MSGTADMCRFAQIVLSDIELVQNSVPDEAGVSFTSIVVLVTPWVFLPVCQHWWSCLSLIHESVKVARLQRGTVRPGCQQMKLLWRETAQFLSHCHYRELIWVGAQRGLSTWQTAHSVLEKMSAFAWRCKTRGRSKLGQGYKAWARISVCLTSMKQSRKSHIKLSLSLGMCALLHLDQGSRIERPLLTPASVFRINLCSLMRWHHRHIHKNSGATGQRHVKVLISFLFFLA